MGTTGQFDEKLLFRLAALQVVCRQLEAPRQRLRRLLAHRACPQPCVLTCLLFCAFWLALFAAFRNHNWELPQTAFV